MTVEATYTRKVVCDRCKSATDERDPADWFTLAKGIDEMRLWRGGDWHFCSAGCLAAWAEEAA